MSLDCHLTCKRISIGLYECFYFGRYPFSNSTACLVFHVNVIASCVACVHASVHVCACVCARVCVCGSVNYAANKEGEDEGGKEKGKGNILEEGDEEW